MVETVEMLQTNEYFDADFGKFVKGLLEKHHVPGVSICVVEAGKASTQVYLPLNSAPPFPAF